LRIVTPGARRFHRGRAVSLPSAASLLSPRRPFPIRKAHIGRRKAPSRFHRGPGNSIINRIDFSSSAPALRHVCCLQMAARGLSIYWLSEDALARDWLRSGLDGAHSSGWRLASVAGAGEPRDLGRNRLADALEFSEKYRLEIVAGRHGSVVADRLGRLGDRHFAYRQLLNGQWQRSTTGARRPGVGRARECDRPF
jgi:hypothetical protein